MQIFALCSPHACVCRNTRESGNRLSGQSDKDNPRDMRRERKTCGIAGRGTQDCGVYEIDYAQTLSLSIRVTRIKARVVTKGRGTTPLLYSPSIRSKHQNPSQSQPHRLMNRALRPACRVLHAANSHGIYILRDYV